RHPPPSPPDWGRSANTYIPAVPRSLSSGGQPDHSAQKTDRLPGCPSSVPSPPQSLSSGPACLPRTLCLPAGYNPNSSLIPPLFFSPFLPSVAFKLINRLN